ncbi:Putative ribonuclease H protein At1g65750 [Linum perenne]
MLRFRRVLKTVISPNQFAFIDGRNITEASLLANEVVDSRRASGKNGLVFKLDLEKAFDSISWSCILNALKAFGLSGRWIDWIHACISSVHFYVLVNEESTDFFWIRRGIERGWIRGFHMNERDGIGEINHLLYADDTLLFCEAEEEQVRNLFAILLCFQAVSGLRINFKKRSLFAIGCVPDINIFSQIFGCKVESFPTSYLGLPLGGNPSSVAMRDPVLNNTLARLSSWKVRHLSFGGRLVLVKHVLSALPSYYMSLFKAPYFVINKLEKWQRNFLWNGCSEERGFHAVNWNIVKADVVHGGLGVVDLRSMNSALLCKWLWRYASCPTSWWRKLIDWKNGGSPSYWRFLLNSGFGSWSVWKNILQFDPLFWTFASVDLGDGNDISFCYDCWMQSEGVSDLKTKYHYNTT